MERMLLKGLIFIAGIWLIWNSSKGVTELAKTNTKEPRPSLEAKTPAPSNTKPGEEREPAGTFYMKTHEE